MIERVIVRKSDVQQTCWACPSQWEGQTVDGVSLYIRYRWGCLSVDSPFDSYNGKTLMDVRVGDGLAGFMDDQEMYEQTSKVIRWID